MKYVQVTGKYPITIQYCEDNKLTTVFSINQREVTETVIICQAYLSKLLMLENVAKQANVITQAQQLHLPPTIAILKSQRIDVLENISNQIQQGLGFIERFIPHLAKLETHANDIAQYLHDRVEKYKQYAPIINQEDEIQNKISIADIEHVIEKLNILTKIQQVSSASSMVR